MTEKEELMAEIIATAMNIFDESFRRDAIMRDAINPNNLKDFDAAYDICQTMYAHGFWTAYINVMGIDDAGQIVKQPPPELH